jgi:hypothetical protein
MGETFAGYLDMAKNLQSGVKQRPAFIRGLYALSKRLGASLLERALTRAQAYNVFDLGAIERIAVQFIEMSEDAPIHGGDTAYDYQKRPTYREGLYTEENPFDYTQLS